MIAEPFLPPLKLTGTYPPNQAVAWIPIDHVDERWARITRIGLEILHPLSEDEDEAWAQWLHIGAEVDSIYGAGPWALGDWIEAGQARFGEKYAQAMDWTRYSYKHLANVTWVVRHFPFSRRREELSFGHHAAVAGLDPKAADKALKTAVRYKMSIDTMMEYLRGECGPEVEDEVDVPQRLSYAIKLLDVLLRLPGLLGVARNLIRSARAALAEAQEHTKAV